MKNLFRSGVVLLLLLSGCGKETPTRPNNITPVTSIAITADDLSIPKGTTDQLTATGNFSGFFTDDITGQVTWTSNTPDIADFITPTSPGRLTGLVPGVATLTASKVTAKGTVSASFNVLVNDATITKMEITPKDTSVPKGKTIEFTVLGTFSDGSTKDMTFEAKWESSDITKATIGDFVDKKQIVKAIELGDSDITATFQGIIGTSKLTVTAPELKSITVTTTNGSVSVLSLSSVTFKATGTYSDESQNDITSQVSWSSSIPTIATPPPIGGNVAKALTQGTTLIGASLGGVVSDPFSLKVTGGNLASIAVTPAVSILVRGTSVRLTATGTFSSGATRDITEVVEWSTSAPAIATVDTPAGNLTFLNALSTASAQTQITVTAKSGTVSSPAANLTVTIPTLQTIAITPPTLDLNVQTSGPLTATGTFSDGSTQDVTASATWTSTAPATASVGDTGSTKGQVKGVAGGTTTITATIGSVVSTINPTVTVTARTVRDLTIGTVAVAQGSQVKFTATASYLDGSPSKDVTEVVEWSIDKPNVAILADPQNQPGQVVGVDTGTATITASLPLAGKSATATITVP